MKYKCSNPILWDSIDKIPMFLMFPTSQIILKEKHKDFNKVDSLLFIV